MGWLDDQIMRWWNDWMKLMTGWPVDWMTKGPMMGLLDDQMTGWLDDWMTGWPDVQMTRWPDDRKLCRRLTIWYILILTALNLNAQTTSMLRHHSSYCGQFAVLFWEISILDHNMKLVQIYTIKISDIDFTWSHGRLTLKRFIISCEAEVLVMQNT